jgi:hypothetical protein
MTGMRHFTPGELGGMQGTQSGAMMDTGRIWRYSEAEGDYGAPKASYTPDAVTVCGLDLTSGRNLRKPEYLAPVVDARLRLPAGTQIEAHDKFEVLSRYGQALGTSLFFEVDGPAREGPSGVVVDLRRSTAVA